MQRHSRQLLQAILQTARSTAAHVDTASSASSSRVWSCASPIWPHTQHSTFTTTTCYSILHHKQRCGQALPQYALYQLQQRGFAAQTQTRPQNRALKTGLQRAAPSGTQALYLLAFTVAMIGVTYASVPLYRMFCQATGYGGTVQQGSTGKHLPAKCFDHDCIPLHDLGCAAVNE